MQTAKNSNIINLALNPAFSPYTNESNMWHKRLWKINSFIQPVLKRTLDIFVSSFAILTLSPLLLATITAICCESKGNVFFKQTRVGKYGKPFSMWKFRSMFIDAEARKQTLFANNEMQGGVIFKMKQDPRITQIGKYIRKFSIDELPQLWNVLRGDMSLVGPRPALPSEVENYTIHERKRLAAKPGITCIWQVSGRSDIPFNQQVELDRRYIAQSSIYQDISLLLRTIPAVVLARGAY